MTPETVRATPRVNAGGPRDASLAVGAPDTAKLAEKQRQIEAFEPTPEAMAAARDLAFESLIEVGSLAESYSRSLTEAAWRGDQPTVEIHLRQLRACVLACIDFF